MAFTPKVQAMTADGRESKLTFLILDGEVVLDRPFGEPDPLLTTAGDLTDQAELSG